MTLKENLEIAFQKLKEKNVEEPRRKARLLLCSVLNMKKEMLLLYSNQEMVVEKEEEYRKGIQKLMDGEPLQYITHYQEFMKLDFYVDENVLIPRADTEITVEEVIAYCQKKRKLRILDLCTGSGAIAISLGKYLPDCEIMAVDISEGALEIAKKNAKQNQVQNITWVLSDLFQEISGKFDVIVSNPPYIKTSVIPTLEQQVQKEPMLALDGGEDGLQFYKKIIYQAEEYLEEKGSIFLEIGYDQKEEVISIIQENGQYAEIETKKDLYGNNRMIMAKKN